MGGKDERAKPVASLYELGRVSHVRGVDLDELEGLLTTWVPEESDGSPDRMDPLVHGVWELAGLAHTSVDQTAAARGVAEAQRQLAQATRTQNDVFGGGRRSMSRL